MKKNSLLTITFLFIFLGITFVSPQTGEAALNGETCFNDSIGSSGEYDKECQNGKLYGEQIKQTCRGVTDYKKCVSDQAISLCGNPYGTDGGDSTCTDHAIRTACNNDSTCVRDTTVATGETTSGVKAGQSGWSCGILEPVCVYVRSIFYWFISLPVTISGIFLYFAGTLFDNAVAFTISNFSQNYNAFFAQGVDLVWASFRDVANIVMIGVFVYISFRVMLQMESFQMKGFAARLVVVALLINFSLFFTKVIIDVSNITATQFVRATGTTVGNQTIPGVGVVQTNVTSIGQEFMKRAGVSDVSFSGASEAVKGIGENKDLPGGSVLKYIIITTIFFLAVGSVLLHGAILLITRMIALVLLMVTSSFAWVSWMTPKLDKFWYDWWDKMLKYALFAPVYMLLLWAVLKITDRLGSGATPIHSLATQQDLFTATIQVAIVVGMLYGATKIADSLSIAGAKQAKNISLKGFGAGARMAGITMPINAAAGLVRGGASLTRVANKELYNRTGGWVGSAKLDKQIEEFNKNFRLSSTSLGKQLGVAAPTSLEDKAKFYAKNMADKAKSKAETAQKENTQKEKDAVRNAAPPNESSADAKKLDTVAKGMTEAGKKAAEEQVKAARANAAGAWGAAPQGGIDNRIAKTGTQGKGPSADAENKASATRGVERDNVIDQLAEEINARGQQPSSQATEAQKRDADKEAAKQRVDNIVNKVLGINDMTPEQLKKRAESIQAAGQKTQAQKEVAEASRQIMSEWTRDLKGKWGDAVRKEVTKGGKSDFELETEKLVKQLEKFRTQQPPSGGGKTDTSKIEQKLDTIANSSAKTAGTTAQMRKDNLKS